MDNLSALNALNLNLPSKEYILGTILFSIIGWIAYRHGKKEAYPQIKWIGVALMFYGYFASETWALYLIGGGLCAWLYWYYRQKPANTLTGLPLPVKEALLKIGRDLRIAREKRGEGLRDGAARLGVPVLMLQRMEGGDPKVSASVYATGLWVNGRIDDLSSIADPKNDPQAEDTFP